MSKYDDAVANGGLATLLSQKDDDMYILNLGNIMPDEQVVVEITILRPLKFENGAYVFSMPVSYLP